MLCCNACWLFLLRVFNASSTDAPFQTPQQPTSKNKKSRSTMVNLCWKLAPRPASEHANKPPKAVEQDGQLYIYVYEDSKFVCSYCGSVSALGWIRISTFNIPCSTFASTFAFPTQRSPSHTSPAVSTSRHVESCMAQSSRHQSTCHLT